ncbi:MAG: pilus assembly protein PilM [Candidatus Omnitrophica bacterium]|nr:pilus assembly protein PilM [Candidatus Omnitrophota bacterium]
MKLPFIESLTEKVKTSVSKISLRNVPEYLVIDVSGGVVKFIYAIETSGRIVIQHIASKEVQEDAEDQIAQFIEQCLTQYSVTTRRVICAIPSKLFISRNIDMPSNNRDEIAKIINLQVGRFTPYSRDEIVIDYICREIEGQHYTNVLLFIVHRKVVERYYRILEQVGLMIDKIAINSEGLALVSNSMVRAASESGKVIGSVHVGENATDLTILSEGQMVFARSIPLGAQTFKTDRKASEEEFVNQLNKSLSAYQDEGLGKAVEILEIAGLTEGLEEMSERFKAAMPLSGGTKGIVKFVDYRVFFEFSDEVQKELEQQKQISFFDLLSCLVKVDSLTLDLVPKEIKLKRQVREGGKEAMRFGILIMTIFLLISTMLVLKIYVKSVQLDKLNKINAKTFDQARSLGRVSTKTRVVRKLLENRGRGLYVFDKVTAIIGDDIYLTEFSYDAEGNLTISGTAESMSRVFAFVTQLEESNYFSSVKTKETKTRREGKNEVADFVIEGVLAEGF